MIVVPANRDSDPDRSAQRTLRRYEHLPIYKQAMDVAVHFEKVVAGFSRYHTVTGTDPVGWADEGGPTYGVTVVCGADQNSFAVSGA